jgi:putative flippase GtrA
MQFLLYCLFGGMGAFTDFAIFHLALASELGYQAANGLGYLAGAIVSFTLNRHFTFAVRDRTGSRLVLFLGVASVGFASSALLLWLLVGVFDVNAYVSKLATLPMVVLLQFSLNRRLTFQVTEARQA